MRHIICIFFLIVSFGVVADSKIDDQVRYISDQDKAMLEAIKIARSKLDQFFETAKSPPPGASDFKLKVKVSDERGVEHLWFSPFKEVEGGYAGVLVNEPNVIKSMQYGKVYAFRKSQITDWGYVLDGKQIGSYTVCVLFKSMDNDLVERYKKDHGFVCGAE